LGRPSRIRVGNYTRTSTIQDRANRCNKSNSDDRRPRIVHSR
jgi:hypothetical protein